MAGALACGARTRSNRFIRGGDAAPINLNLF
ncbi:hypothetical protein BTH_II0897 [Burkholderia thailandensis E264]|uniref:Uncharacterized protein n=1 Tax=Burkholderia thailandensis (strain ATCC 700388 / DSM 13276 / CCUG 48851 / CIP 106301 / E264) TaxID=271848 RepID=Q2T6V5_BURTA|nr:hypothetical protein BTH_II0897 [Burkholderia thailandensis E264]